MSIKGDVIALGIVAAMIAAAAWYAKRKLSGLADLVPDVVYDGADAAGTLAWEAAKAVAHPLDSFGVAPGKFADGSTKYQTVAPWTNADDTVSNGPGGMNYNQLGG